MSLCDTGGDAETNPNINNNNSSRSAGMKALKLPPFNEDKDDLDAYLIRYERACTAFEVRQEHRCRVLSLSDRRYSLNPLSQTRIG